MGLGVVGLEPDRRAEFGDHRLQLSLVPQGYAEFVVRNGGVGCCPRLFPNQMPHMRTAPMAATTGPSVTLRPALSGKDGETGGSSLWPPWVSDGRQREQGPAASLAGSGAPHRGASLRGMHRP